MSAYGVTKLAWDLEHCVGLMAEFDADHVGVLDRYALTGRERDAVLARDATALLAAGVNPVALRNLMVLIGAAGAQMYTQAHDGVKGSGVAR